jgi:5'(3')-deoxyribonucleotidase
VSESQHERTEEECVKPFFDHHLVIKYSVTEVNHPISYFVMNSKPIIFLDMDGVCTDFYKRVMQAFNQPYPPAEWPARVGETHKIFNITPEEFWTSLQEKDPHFWEHMEAFPYFTSFYEELSKLAPVYYLTAPNHDPTCLKGKVAWMQKQHGSSFMNYIITTHKHFIAKPNHILIDDTPIKLDNFRSHGGHGVLFQQPWNTPGASDRPDLVCLEEVKTLIHTMN